MIGTIKNYLYIDLVHSFIPTYQLEQNFNTKHVASGEQHKNMLVVEKKSHDFTKTLNLLKVNMVEEEFPTIFPPYTNTVTLYSLPSSSTSVTGSILHVP